MGKELEPAGDRHVPKEYVGKIEPNYYCRAWNSKREKYCKARAGMGTDHVGQGRCKFHRGQKEITHGIYSNIERERIRDLYEEFAAAADPLDLEPEVAMLRAIYRDFIERYDQYLNAVLIWYANIPEELQDAILAVAGPKPKKLLDLSDGYRILREIGVMVERIEKVKAAHAISRKDFYRLIQEYARIVDARVDDDAIKEQIKSDWLQVRLA